MFHCLVLLGLRISYQQTWAFQLKRTYNHIDIRNYLPVKKKQAGSTKKKQQKKNNAFYWVYSTLKNVWLQVNCYERQHLPTEGDLIEWHSSVWTDEFCLLCPHNEENWEIISHKRPKEHQLGKILLIRYRGRLGDGVVGWLGGFHTSFWSLKIKKMISNFKENIRKNEYNIKSWLKS